MRREGGLRRKGSRAGGRLLAAAALVLALGAGNASAQISTGNATEYEVTVVGVSLCTDATCATKFGVGSGSKKFDIASGAVGKEIGSFGDLSNLPIGVTVTHLEVVMLRSFQITGSVNVNGTVCFTDATKAGSIAIPTQGKKTGPATSQTLFIPNVGLFGTEPSAQTYASAGVTLLGNLSLSGIVSLSQPFTLTAVSPQVRIGFSTKDSVGAALVGGNCVMLVQPPEVRITIN